MVRGRSCSAKPEIDLRSARIGPDYLFRNSSLGRDASRKREGPAVIAGPSQNAGKFGVAFRSFGT